ncbi:MAG: hypothetical protein Q4G61_03555 [Tissierellia bacterium]|nr:hypothetical protein [Tissierellia bacterium]
MKWYELSLIGITLVCAFYLRYQLYKIVEIDAGSRGLKRPRLWAFVASGQENARGLIPYLIVRRKYVSTISASEQQIINERKRKAGIGIIGMLLFGLITLAILIFNYL